MTTITVFTKPDCVQCDRTKKVMDKKGISYEVIDLLEDPAALEKVKELGYLQAPVVMIDGDSADHWSGFRPDKINAISV